MGDNSQKPYNGRSGIHEEVQKSVSFSVVNPTTGKIRVTIKDGENEEITETLSEQETKKMTLQRRGMGREEKIESRVDNTKIESLEEYQKEWKEKNSR